MKQSCGVAFHHALSVGSLRGMAGTHIRGGAGRTFLQNYIISSVCAEECSLIIRKL